MADRSGPPPKTCSRARRMPSRVAGATALAAMSTVSPATRRSYQKPPISGAAGLELTNADRLQPAAVDLGDIAAVLRTQRQEPRSKAGQPETRHRKAEINQIQLDQQRGIAYHLDVPAGDPAERSACPMGES